MAPAAQRILLGGDLPLAASTPQAHMQPGHAFLHYESPFQTVDMRTSPPPAPSPSLPSCMSHLLALLSPPLPGRSHPSTLPAAACILAFLGLVLLFLCGAIAKRVCMNLLRRRQQRRRGNQRLGGGGVDDDDNGGGSDGRVVMGDDKGESGLWRVRRDRVSLAGEEGEKGEGREREMDEEAYAGLIPPEDSASGHLPGHLRI